MKRLMTVRVFSCSCDNVILPSFITFIGYQKETKSQVNPKETLSQVNNMSAQLNLEDGNRRWYNTDTEQDVTYVSVLPF